MQLFKNTHTGKPPKAIN